VQKGDIIYVLDVFDTGLCHGVLRNHIGVFRLSDVETVRDESTLLAARGRATMRPQRRRSKPKTVEELLSRLGLQVRAIHLTPFIYSGNYTLKSFAESRRTGVEKNSSHSHL